MKNLFFTLLLTTIGFTTAFAQNWQTNFSKAQEQAKNENKKLILVFQGSDWCAPCIKLDREIWSTDTFKKYANDNYVMVQADFPRRKKNALPEAQTKANAQLAENYNKKGVFPFVVVFDKNGKVVGETSYKKTSTKAYIDLLNSFSK